MYKRQGPDRGRGRLSAQALFLCGAQRPGQGIAAAVLRLSGQGAGPVSYTHLDVYKRQLVAPALQDLLLKTEAVELTVADHAVGTTVEGLLGTREDDGLVRILDKVGQRRRRVGQRVGAVADDEACLLYTSCR